MSSWEIIFLKMCHLKAFFRKTCNDCWPTVHTLPLSMCQALRSENVTWAQDLHSYQYNFVISLRPGLHKLILKKKKKHNKNKVVFIQLGQVAQVEPMHKNAASQQAGVEVTWGKPGTDPRTLVGSVSAKALQLTYSEGYGAGFNINYGQAVFHSKLQLTLCFFQNTFNKVHELRVFHTTKFLMFKARDRRKQRKK